MKTFVIGDIHGANKALIQCLERSNFNKEEDTLICLGDICDGWSEVYDVVETLLSIENLILIKGNHDVWFTEWLTKGVHPISWLHGGYATLSSYAKHADRDVQTFTYKGGWESNLTFVDVPPRHQKLLMSAHNYYVDNNNRCFVHGGFNRHEFIDSQHDDYIYYWDRDLWAAALSNITRSEEEINKYPFKTKNNFDKIFIGHTSTTNWGTDEPMFAGPVINIDTGGGFKGKVTIMNVDTEEYWQSDLVFELYTNEKGR